MQIAVVNQKTRSIPSRSFEAFGGSQGTSSATTVAAAPKRTPSPISWTIEPLRTGTETSECRSVARGRNRTALNSVFKSERRVDYGTRSQPDLDRSGRRPHLGGRRHNSSGVDVHPIGIVLLVVGLIGALLSMIFWSSWAGPGYFTAAPHRTSTKARSARLAGTGPAGTVPDPQDRSLRHAGSSNAKVEPCALAR